MHEVLVNRLGGLSLPRKSVVRLTDRPDMTLDVYRGRKTKIQQFNIIERAVSPILKKNNRNKTKTKKQSVYILMKKLILVLLFCDLSLNMNLHIQSSR